MPSKKDEPKKFKIIPYRSDGEKRIYSNHVEINFSSVDVNIKFCDARPPENEDDRNKISEDRSVKVPIVSEIVLPLPVAAELKRILNERLKEENDN